MPKELRSKTIIDSHVEILKKKCSKLREKGHMPNLKVILVGSNDASVVYTKNKKKFCERVGANCEILKLPENTSEKELLGLIEKLNIDPKVNGLFVQLPLPKHLDNLSIEELIIPKKDVDGFHPLNLFELLRGSSSKALISCTPKGIMTLLQEEGIDLSGKKVVIFGRSMIVGKPLALLMIEKNATVTIAHSKTKNAELLSQSADIVICAIGRANHFGKEYFKDDQSQIVIDVGINRNHNGKLCGDVDFQEVAGMVKAITPVPGGVGPMTILSLIENLILATERSLSE